MTARRCCAGRVDSARVSATRSGPGSATYSSRCRRTYSLAVRARRQRLVARLQATRRTQAAGSSYAPIRFQRVSARQNASPTYSRPASFWAIRSARTPAAGQPPKWCIAITSLLIRDSTGAPDDPAAVSQR